jgi:tRNA nucleotidyltransferase/poly(A) polymerase
VTLATGWLDRQPLLQKVINILKDQQLEAYLVGGAVRDLLLEKGSVVDLDFAVPSDGLVAARKVADLLGAAFYPLDAERGTGRVVYSPGGPKKHLDFATFRGDTLEADLRDRDFTINAMALRLTRPPALIDPLNGRRDLEKGEIRAVSVESFEHDPVRVLRAIRQAQELGFQIETETQGYLQQAAPRLTTTSPERQRDELIRLLATPAPDQTLISLQRLEVLSRWLPEIEAMAGVPQSPPHHLDVFEHTAAALAAWTGMLRAGLPQLPAKFQDQAHAYLNKRLAGELRWQQLISLALLWHDTGKPRTYGMDGDRIRFFGHEQVSATLVADRLVGFHFSNQAIRLVKTVVAHHMRPLLLAADRKPVSSRAIYRFFRDTGEQGIDAGVAVILHALADHQATYPPGQGQAGQQALDRVVARLLAAYFEHQERVVDPPPLLTGHELMAALGLPPGPTIGRILDRLKEAQASGQVTDRASALAFIKSDPDFVQYQNQG